MRKVRIIYVIGQLGRGGAEKQLYELLRGIDEHNFNPMVISLSQSGYWAGQIRKLNIEVLEIPRGKFYRLVRLYKLLKIFKRRRPDIIHTYMSVANFYGSIVSIATRVPIVIISERGSEKWTNSLQAWFYRLLLPFTDKIICNSFRQKECFSREHKINSNHIITIHNGINFSQFQSCGNIANLKKSFSFAKDEKIVGTVGHLTAVKNIRLFIQAAKIIYESLLHCRFIIVGHGPLEKELKQYAVKLGIENAITFIGERKDVSDLLQLMDVFVLTSHYESLSNAIMEAMASGLPCVVTDVGGNSELVVHNETGYLIPPNNLEELAEKIIYLLKNKKIAREMGKKGKRRIIQNFNAKKMVEATEKIYLEQIRRKSKNSRCEL